MSYSPDVIAVIGGYLLGSVSFAVVVCRILDLPDPRTRGSGNPGASNVARAGGRWPAALTLCGDVAKAAAPMLLARAWGLSEATVILVGIAAFIGHVYPLYHNFRGGKGVATFGGVLAVMHWPSALVWGAVWLVFAGAFRYVSVASIAASVAAVLYLALSVAVTGEGRYWPAAVTGAAALLIVFRHRDNLRNLRAGTEARIGEGRI